MATEAEITAARDEVSRMLRDQRCDWPHALTDDQLTAAILGALPIDHDDHTTVVQVIPYESGHQKVLWGRPERLAAEILASIRAAEMEA